MVRALLVGRVDPFRRITQLEVDALLEPGGFDEQRCTDLARGTAISRPVAAPGTDRGWTKEVQMANELSSEPPGLGVGGA
jgi:hypothetical protein